MESWSWQLENQPLPSLAHVLKQKALELRSRRWGAGRLRGAPEQGRPMPAFGSDNEKLSLSHRRCTCSAIRNRRLDSPSPASRSPQGRAFRRGIEAFGRKTGAEALLELRGSLRSSWRGQWLYPLARQSGRAWNKEQGSLGPRTSQPPPPPTYPRSISCCPRLRTRLAATAPSSRYSGPAKPPSEPAPAGRTCCGGGWGRSVFGGGGWGWPSVPCAQSATQPSHTK